MKSRDGNRLFRLSLLSAGMIFLLIFAVFVLKSWKYYFHTKPKDWAIQKDRQEAEKEEGQGGRISSKNILLISSDAASEEIIQRQIEGVRAVLDGTEAHLDSFHVRPYSSNDERDATDFYADMNAYLQKKGIIYDGVLVGDDRSLSLVKQYKDSLFPDIPLIFFSIRDQELAKSVSKNSKMTGYYMFSYMKETLDLATALQVRAKSILAIYDNSYLGMEEGKEFLSLQDQFPDYRFEGINFSQLNREEFVQSIENLGEDSILLYLYAGEDKDGNRYSRSQITKLLLSKVSTPIYGYAMDEMIPGFLGGRIEDYRLMAEDATLLLTEILSNRVKIEEQPVVEDSPGTLYVNYRVLTAYRLPGKKLPKACVIEGGIRDIWREYRDIIIIALLPFLSLFLFSLYFVLSRMRSRNLFKILEDENDRLLYEQDQLAHKLRYDYLTELLNRQTALSNMEELLKGSKEFSCVLVDIDNLKELNELRGYETGDLYLSAVANRLKKMERDYGAVASRYGGDEFLIVFPRAILQEDSLEIKEIQAAFYRSITVSGETVYMKASGGIACSEGKAGPKEVVMSAGIALSAAKTKGKNHFVFYTDELRYRKEKINQILKMVERAIQENAFYMVYQPQVECKGRKIVGFESLLRIRNEACSPDQFIPVAEQYGYITKLGKIAVEQVVRQLARWKDEGRTLCPISINFSSYQIYDDDFVDFLLYQMERHGIPHEYVVLEITESILFEESKQTKAVFKRLVDEGIELHLDDFGTGYSSFAYLPYIPLNTVKMDKSIVDNFLSTNGDVVRNLISIVHDLGMVVIVEGVEEEWQYEKLVEYGCDRIQGYLFGGPVLATEIS